MDFNMLYFFVHIYFNEFSNFFNFSSLLFIFGVCCLISIFLQTYKMFLILKKIYLFYEYVHVSECRYVHHMHTDAFRGPEGNSDPLEMK